jgi:hypothetical protein
MLIGWFNIRDKIAGDGQCVCHFLTRLFPALQQTHEDWYSRISLKRIGKEISSSFEPSYAKVLNHVYAEHQGRLRDYYEWLKRRWNIRSLEDWYKFRTRDLLRMRRSSCLTLPFFFLSFFLFFFFFF